MTPQSLLEIGPRPGEQLAGALLTSFEPPDRDLLANRLLPALLGQSPFGTDDTREFMRARAELCDSLNRLRGRIVIVSSPRDDARLPWLNSYVDFRRTLTVQHAKIWLLQWCHASGEERLELVVSSANLTTSGIDGQVQGAWRASVPLGKISQRNRASWSDLSAFLARLGQSIGRGASIQQFDALLGRAGCPAGVRFVATAPGNGPHGTKSLGRALRALPFKPKKIRVMAPFIGAWDRRSIAAWVHAIGAKDVEEIELVVVEKTSAVPESKYWILPQQTCTALWMPATAGELAITFGLLSVDVSKALRGGASIIEDTRWTHAKLYEFSDGARSALLVTSANFTPTAWDNNGKGNFELGVLIEEATLPFQAPAASKEDQLQVSKNSVMEGIGLWGNAQWDGDSITVDVLNKSGIEVEFPTTFAQVVSVEGEFRRIVVPQREVPPPTVTVRFKDESIAVPIIDIRPAPSNLPIGGLPEDSWQAWRDQLLLERYGYTPEPGDGPAARKVRGTGSAAGSDDEYSVFALSDARRYFNYVDGWQAEYDSGRQRQLVASDGSNLLALFRRYRSRPGAVPQVLDAAAEELELRLQLASIPHEQD